jgi:hypothetical protein
MQSKNITFFSVSGRMSLRVEGWWCKCRRRLRKWWRPWFSWPLATPSPAAAASACSVLCPTLGQSVHFVFHLKQTLNTGNFVNWNPGKEGVHYYFQTGVGLGQAVREALLRTEGHRFKPQWWQWINFSFWFAVDWKDFFLFVSSPRTPGFVSSCYNPLLKLAENHIENLWTKWSELTPLSKLVFFIDSTIKT